MSLFSLYYVLSCDSLGVLLKDNRESRLVCRYDNLALEELKDRCRNCGSNLTEKSALELEIEALIAERKEAKKAKNYGEADRIRDELKARGIEIIDTPQGAKWRRV